MLRTPEGVTGIAGKQTCQLCKGEKGPSYTKNVRFFKVLVFLGMLRPYLWGHLSEFIEFIGEKNLRLVLKKKKTLLKSPNQSPLARPEIFLSGRDATYLWLLGTSNHQSCRWDPRTRTDKYGAQRRSKFSSRSILAYLGPLILSLKRGNEVSSCLLHQIRFSNKT